MGDVGWIVNPAPLRPTRSRPLLPIVVCLLCLVIVGVSIYAADIPAWSTRVGSALVPADGAVNYLTANGAGAPVTSVETAQLGVVEAVQSVDQGLSNAVLRALGPTYRGELWRTQSHVIGATGSTTVAVYRTDQGVALVADSDGDRLRTYSPALTLTAPNGSATDRWNVRGMVGGSDGSSTYSGSYSGSFSSTPAGAGCVRVTGSLTITDQAGTNQEDSVRTWCDGRGVVTESVRGKGIRTDEHAVPAPTPNQTDLVDHGYVWPDPASWSVRQVTPAVAVGGTAGQSEALPGSPSALQPVATSDGLLVRPTQGANDLIGLRSQGAAQDAVFRVHPGGTVIGLAAAGNEILVATSQRELVAYDSQGALLWRQALGDIAVGSPLVISGQEPAVAVLTSTGQLILIDAKTGRIDWRQKVGDVLGLAPVAAGGMIIVATSPGTLVAVDQQTGEQRWQATLPEIDQLAAAPNRVLVGEEGNVHSYNARTGRHLWRQALSISVQQLQPVGSRIVVAGNDRSVVLTADGRPQQTAPGYRALSSDGSSWLGWRPGAVDFHDQSGKIIRTLALPALNGPFNPQPVSNPNGAWIFGADWTSVQVGVNR